MKLGAIQICRVCLDFDRVREKPADVIVIRGSKLVLEDHFSVSRPDLDPRQDIDPIPSHQGVFSPDQA
ncbi:hypothetical protein [Streptomyces sp. NPDC090132]|uniref:hypothetical protein n=1 Tax=Streptomyces sp. NPDC090132 TaxID=3365955 RepID=UPI0038094F29